MPKRFFWTLFFLGCANIVFAQFSVDWEAEKRFGNDINGNGKIDIPNSYEYVHPKSFNLKIFLTGPGNEMKNLLSEPREYRWSVKNSDDVTVIGTTTQQPFLNAALPRQGDYSVSVEFDGRTADGIVTVRDYLIVCMGDSFASGEGTPELLYSRKNPSIWADGGLNGAQSVEHIRAHRSALAWGPQAAIFLENYDPRSSITFLFLAISGATIHEGLLGERKPIDETFGTHKMKPQLEVLKELVGDRPVDQLWLSIGGNDLHFANVATVLVVSSSKKDEKYYDYLNRAIEAIKTGKWEEGNKLISMLGYPEDIRPGSDNLEAALTEFDTALKESVTVREVCLLDYLFPIAGSTVTLDKMFPGLMIDPVESKSIIDSLAVPFRAVMKQAADKLGWQYIESAVFPEFAEHASERRIPNKPEDYKGNEWIREGFFPTSYSDFRKYILSRDVRWFRTEEESVIVQGGGVHRKKASTFSTNGTLHPNEYGHQAYMHMLLSAIRLPGFPDYSQEYSTAR